ncbi:MAG: sigma-70 family RNA polymerase sigma factor [Thermoleophilia bacterium]
MGTRRDTGLDRLADEDLVARVATGDAGAFEVVYDRHARVAFSLAFRLLGDRAAAEDLVQDAFLSVWRGADRFSPALGSVRTWVLSIVHHRGIDRLRSSAAAARRELALQQEAHVGGGQQERTEDRAIDGALAPSLHRGLDDLPDDQGRVVRLAYFGGFTHHEIAEMLGLPLGTVKSRLRLGLERLRMSMGAREALS